MSTPLCEQEMCIIRWYFCIRQTQHDSDKATDDSSTAVSHACYRPGGSMCSLPPRTTDIHKLDTMYSWYGSCMDASASFPIAPTTTRLVIGYERKLEPSQHRQSLCTAQLLNHWRRAPHSAFSAQQRLYNTRRPTTRLQQQNAHHGHNGHQNSAEAGSSRSRAAAGAADGDGGATSSRRGQHGHD